MRCASGMLLAAAMMTVAVPAGAQSANGVGQYGSLFQQPKPLAPAPKAQRSPAPPANPNSTPQAQSSVKPSVVCGMTLIPANPKIDPAMKMPTPSNRRFPMLTMEPTICRSSAETNTPSGQTKRK